MNAAIAAFDERADVIEAAMREHSEGWAKLTGSLELPADRRRMLATRDLFHFPKDVLLELRSYNASVSAGQKLKEALNGVRERCASDDDACGKRPACLKATLCAAVSAMEDELFSMNGSPIGSYSQSLVASVRDAIGRADPHTAKGGAPPLDVDAFKQKFRNFSEAFTSSKASRQTRQRRDVEEANVATMLAGVKREAAAQSEALAGAIRRYNTLRPPKELVDATARIDAFLRDAKTASQVLDKIAGGDLDTVVKVQNARTALEALPVPEDEYDEIDGAIQARGAASSRSALQSRAAEIRAEMKKLGMEPRGRDATVAELERALAAETISRKAVA